jgi:hypothetical protein
MEFFQLTFHIIKFLNTKYLNYDHEVNYLSFQEPIIFQLVFIFYYKISNYNNYDIY